MLKKENWRPVTLPEDSSFDGMYEVSNHGRLRSVDRLVTRISRGTEITSLRKGKLFKIGKGRTNLVRLRSTNGTVLGTGVHRLVALAFVKGYAVGLVVRHQDDNTKNNYYKNLVWGTQADNVDDRQKRNRQAKGSMQGSSVLTEAKVKRIKKLMPKSSNLELSAAFGIDPSVISRIRTGDAWRHVTGE